jgi:hypothetical protein
LVPDAQGRPGRRRITGDTPAISEIEAFMDTETIPAGQAELPAAGRPRAIIIGALGRVGTGAADLCTAMNVAVTRWDMAETAGGGPFPEVLQHEIFLNCILARPGCPVFVPESAKQAERQLTVIGDIACDPTSDFSPIKVYSQATDWELPALRVWEAPPLDVMAIDNLPSLLPALKRLHDKDGIDMGARRITVSTSGYPRQMAEFAAADPSYNLAVSLHAADDTLRKKLVPTAKHPVREIVEAAGSYFAQKGREVTFEVVLLAHVNDRPQDAEAMVAALGDMPCTVNLIPWNPVEEIAKTGLRRPAAARVDNFAESLRRGGLKVTVRRQRGADQSAACGQLRLRDIQRDGSASKA